MAILALQPLNRMPFQPLSAPSRPQAPEALAALPTATLPLGFTPLRSGIPATLPGLQLTAPSRIPFAYAPPPFKEVAAARSWQPGSTGMTGVQANNIVTAHYAHLDTAFTRYLGTPDCTNWMSFGKYASREAGGQIHDLEVALRSLHTLKTFDLKPGNDISALKELLALGSSNQIVKQALAMAAAATGVRISDGMTLDELRQLLTQCPLDTFREMRSLVQSMRNGLVAGNTGVYEEIGKVYEIFLQAESAGRDGVAAIKAAGYGTLPPDGYLVAAFEAYQKARELGILASRTPSPAQREQLLAERSQLIARANLEIGIQEQMFILQRRQVFGDPQVVKLTAESAPAMYLPLPDQRLKLIPHGGNWSDFATRMGFREVPAGSPGAMPIRHLNDGQIHHYALAQQREGTISKLFEDYHQGEAAKVLLGNLPRPLQEVQECGLFSAILRRCDAA